MKYIILLLIFILIGLLQSFMTGHPFNRIDFIIFGAKPISFLIGFLILGSFWFICDWISGKDKDK